MTLKKVLLSAVVLAGVSGFSAVNAKSPLSSAISYYVNSSAEELPAAIKVKLASDFKDWTVSSSQLLKTPNGAEYYAVGLKKGDDVKTINFSKEGQVMEAAASGTAPAAPTQAAPSTTAPAKTDSVGAQK